MDYQFLQEIENGSKSALVKKRIITYYMHNGNSTIPELAKELDLSVPTVTKFVDEMCRDGYMLAFGKLETNGGRHPIIYGLNPQAAYFLGVEVKQFAVNIGLINLTGEMVARQLEIPYEFENTPAGLDRLCQLILAFLDSLEQDKSKILNINVNVSGRVNPERGYSFSHFCFEERPLAEVLASRLGHRVTIDNDTRAMAYGEYMQGRVTNERNIIFVNVSWGVAIGIIIDGKVYTGRSGFSGEFGHICAYDNEILCRCGKKGCIETEASGLAMHRKLLERIRHGESSILSAQARQQGVRLTLHDIIEATNKGDMLCIEIVEEIGQKLGKQIAGLINIFNPDMLIIGGSLSATGDYLTQSIKTAVRKYSLDLVSRDSKIVTSKLKGLAGVTGACMLARTRAFEP